MSLPYFPYYAKDYQAKVMHLSFAEEGAYIRLLRQCWFSPDGTIPADDTWIFRKMIARSEEEKHVLRTILDEFFIKENGRYYNDKLCQVMLTQNEQHAKRVEAGRKGGKVKPLKNKGSMPSNAKAMLKQPEPEPEYIKTIDKSIAKKPDKRGSRIPDNWQPPSIPEFYDKEQITKERIQHEADRFKDYWIGVPGQKGVKLDWTATWRNWLRKNSGSKTTAVGKHTGSGKSRPVSIAEAVGNRHRRRAGNNG